MSFNIHVSGGGPGSRRFLYQRGNVPDGDEWDLSTVETQVLSRVGISAPPSITGSATRHAMMAMSRIAQIHMLVTVVTMIMAEHQAGTLSVAVRHHHTLWPTTGGFVSIRLGGDRSATVVRDLLRFLRAQGVDKWGPIIEIMAALSGFQTGYDGRPGYTILVILSD